ncbi:MAG: hypothetical protein JST36_00315, partial [Bacteroidetes bacterium]|nr:hypothetical protein [Bacteroidota bacterium]
ASVNGSGLTKDSRYKDEITIHYRMGNIHDITDKKGITTIYLWDYNNDFPVAKITGALPTDTIAYTSFEADGSGGWSIPVSNRTKTTYVTGSQCYSLTNGPVSTINSLPSKQYKVTVWARTQPTVSGATGSPIIGRSFNGFKYYEFTTGTVTSVTISGTGLIDELRLYPQDAQMTTYTYEPLVGMTSQCDVNNNITYYEYDGLGRLITIRDMDKNILKKFGYNYAGQKFVANTFTNQTHIKAFTKMSCSDTSLVAVELVDSVMAGSFFSEVSQGEADTMAINYLDSSGQANADLNGACAEPVTLTLVNYDHITDFTLTLTDVYDSTKTFTIPFPLDSAITTARIPQGRYDILIAKPGNVDSHVFTASGPGGSIEVNSSSGSWSNVYVNTDVFDKLTIGIPQ